MKPTQFVLTATLAFVALAGSFARADNMASIAVAPATGAVTLTPRWAVGSSLAGFHHMAQDLSLGGGANQFHSIKGTPIPAGGDISAFTLYVAGSGAATQHADIGSKLTPNSYSALTSADPDVGFGSVNFYLIHHKDTGDYFSVIKPSSGNASAVTDLKPMSGPGGPGTLGDSGYFGLTFAAANLGYGLNQFYYLRTDPVTGVAIFGSLAPALLGTATDHFDLGTGGYNALAFTGSDVGFGTDKMYYLRLDPITGFTILGTLHPITGRSSDIANLGSVFSTLTFVPGDLGFGGGNFYTTGAINPSWQSVSFAAIDDRQISAGPFTVAPSASSALPITLTVVPSSVGSASISGPVGGVFTVTPTAPGEITLQATQAGQTAPTPYEFNMLRQSFVASGAATLEITTDPSSQSAVAGSTVNFSVIATGTTSLSYQWRKGGVAITGNGTAGTATLSLPSVDATADGSYDVVVTNNSGSVISTPALLTVTTGTPVITHSSPSAAGTVNSPFSYTISASNSPTSYSASPLPAGLTIDASTGAITGTPTTAGITSVLLGATSPSGTGNATLTITVAAAGVAPSITNNPLTAPGTVGSPYSFTITASGSPTSYSATPLPAGLSLSPSSGMITGTPTAVGTTYVVLGATNAVGTDNTTLTITVAAAGVAPIITNDPLVAVGTVGTPFSFTFTAAGSPFNFSASPLSPGLSIVSTTGAITGIPTTAGQTTTVLTATNAFGSDTATLTVTIAEATATPSITSPSTASGSVGAPFVTYLINATGAPTSYSAAGLPAGVTLNSLTGAISGTPTTAGTSTVTLSATNSAGTGTSSLVITIAPAAVAPIITSGGSATGTVGLPFATYWIKATGLPTSYAGSGRPPGLSVNPLTGAINGTPTTAGTYVGSIQATNQYGTSTTPLTITIAEATVTPVITSPSTASGSVGAPFVTYLINATGMPTSYSAVGLPAGMTLNSSTGEISGTPTTAGTSTVTLSATNSAGTGTSSLVITIAPAAVAPVITSGGSATGTVGLPFATYWIEATGQPTSYAGSGLPPGLSVDPLTGAINGTPTAAGTYVGSIQATNQYGTSTTTLTIVTGGASRIVNFSARAVSGPGEQTLIMGFVIDGNGKNLLVRGIGPGLTPYGVVNVITDPMLTLFNGDTPLATNDDWETPLSGQASAADVAATSARVGAFALPNGSKDSALLAVFNNGAHTTSMLRPNSTTGVALTEIYDTDVTSAARLINVSARMNVTAGEGTLIAGLVIAGDLPKTVLIRGVGPTLSDFGVAGVLADPLITLFSGSTVMASNDNWEAGSSTPAELNMASARVGAFALTAGSKDAALLVTLEPGTYTVHVTGVGSPNGVALIEVYDAE